MKNVIEFLKGIKVKKECCVAGSAAAQALQLCATPPFIAAAAAGGGGQTPFMLPGHHIPISQPPYPIIRPMPLPGSNAFLVSKFS